MPERRAVSVRAIAAAAVAVPTSVPALAPVGDAPYTAPAALPVSTEVEAGPTVIVAPATAEETLRIQRGRGRSRLTRRAAVVRVTVAGVFVVAVGGALVWRCEVADALRTLAHVVGLRLA